jgi:hydrogenase maturation protease
VGAYEMKRTVVIGIGNTLLGDEGVGVHALNKLRLEGLSEDIQLVEGGVGGIALLNYVRGADRVIFIDAVSGSQPGRAHRLTERDLNTKVKTLLHPMSLHDVGLAEMIKIGQAVYPNEMPKEIIIYGIEIKEPKTYSSDLSKEVRNSMNKVVELIVKELKEERNSEARNGSLR